MWLVNVATCMHDNFIKTFSCTSSLAEHRKNVALATTKTISSKKVFNKMR